MYWFDPGLGETLMCFGTEWLGGGRLSFVVTPTPGVPLDFASFRWTSWKDRQTSPVVVDRATVTVDGVQVATFDPMQPIGDYVVDLSTVPQLRNVDRAITFVVEFDGAAGGNTSFEFRSMSVSASSCIEGLTTDGRAFWWPIPGEEPRFRALEGARFSETGLGSAQISAAIVNMANPCQRFSVVINLGGLVGPGDPGYPPVGSPTTSAFVDANLISVGGIIDPSTWRYYTTLSGTMTGQLCYEGARVDLSRIAGSPQVGVGANLFDLSFGASSWMAATVITQPTSGPALPSTLQLIDFNFDIGNNCRCFGGVQASWTNYGVGVAGCAGVPTLVMQNLPLLGSSPAFEVSNTGPGTTAAALIWSFTPGQLFIPFLGGDLLVGSPFATVTSLSIPSSGYFFNCTLVEDPCMVGHNVYLQAITLDSCGPAGFGMSRGLAVTIGDM